MNQKTYTKQEISKLLGCHEKTISNHVKKAVKENKNSCLFKNKVYYFKKTKSSYIYSFTSFDFNTDVDIDIKVDVNTDIENLNLNIKVNGNKVN